MRGWNRLSLLGRDTRGSLPEFHYCDDYDGSHEEEDVDDGDDGNNDGDDVDNDGDDVDNDGDDVDSDSDENVDHILAATTAPSCSLAISSLSLTHSSLVLPSFSADHDDNL